MKAYWVIDILKDIRQFSEKNGMVELAEQLDDAIFVAASEIGKLAGCRNRSTLEQARLEALLERLQTTKSIEELQVWAHELRDYFGVTPCHLPHRQPQGRAGRRLHLQPRLGAPLHREGLPQHRPRGARRGPAVPPDGLEDARLVEPSCPGDDARGDGGRARQPGLVGADLGSAGRVRAVRGQPPGRRRRMGRLHRRATPRTSCSSRT